MNEGRFTAEITIEDDVCKRFNMKNKIILNSPHFISSFNDALKYFNSEFSENTFFSVGDNRALNTKFIIAFEVNEIV